MAGVFKWASCLNVLNCIIVCSRLALNAGHVSSVISMPLTNGTSWSATLPANLVDAMTSFYDCYLGHVATQPLGHRHDRLLREVYALPYSKLYHLKIGKIT